MATPHQRQLLLIGASLLIMASFWYTAADRHRIARAYQETQTLVKRLETERTQLQTELDAAQHTIDQQSNDLSTAQARLEQLKTQLAALQQDQERLQLANTSLTGQLNLTLAEKQQLEAKLSSIHELKLAIRDLRYKMWQQRFAAMREWFQRPRTTDHMLAAGNRGYLVRDGLSTLGTTTRLHVRVLEPEPQPR